jgi:hypothetical protein
MIDLQTAVQEAVFTALEGSSGVTSLGDVWQNAPEDADLVAKGLVIIGLVALIAPEAKDGGFEKATVPVFTYVRRPDATELYALNSAVRTALEGQVITATGAELGRPVFLSADPELMEDGETYFDKLLFEMFVQPA